MNQRKGLFFHIKCVFLEFHFLLQIEIELQKTIAS